MDEIPAHPPRPPSGWDASHHASISAMLILLISNTVDPAARVVLGGSPSVTSRGWSYSPFFGAQRPRVLSKLSSFESIGVWMGGIEGIGVSSVEFTRGDGESGKWVVTSPPLSVTDIYTQSKLCEQDLPTGIAAHALDAKCFDATLWFLCGSLCTSTRSIKGHVKLPNVGTNVRVFETPPMLFRSPRSRFSRGRRLARCDLTWCGVLKLAMANPHR